MKGSSYDLAHVRSAEDTPITIPPNSRGIKQSYSHNELPYKPVCGMLSPTVNSHIPADLDIEPSVITYDTARTTPVPVHVSNITINTVQVRPHALLCEILQVKVENFPKSNLSEESDITDQVDFPRDEFTQEHIQQIQRLLSDFDTLFSKGDTDIGYCPFVEHKIQLDDQRPFKQRYRRNPPSMLDEVRDHIGQQLSAGIIRRSHSPFLSNVVLVRICIDYGHLNSRSKKDNYALPRIDEILDSLAGNTWFSVLDMRSG